MAGSPHMHEASARAGPGARATCVADHSDRLGSDRLGEGGTKGQDDRHFKGGTIARVVWRRIRKDFRVDQAGLGFSSAPARDRRPHWLCADSWDSWSERRERRRKVKDADIDAMGQKPRHFIRMTRFWPFGSYERAKA